VYSRAEPLRLDFESGDLSFWQAEGDAFIHQPVRGDKVRASRARPGLVPLGGDYWDGPYPVGLQGDYWISTEDHLTGTLTSNDFLIDENYPWFSFLIGGGDDIDNLRVELLIKVPAQKKERFSYLAEFGKEHASYRLMSLEGKSDYYRVFAATGNNSEIMRRVVLNVAEHHLVGEHACIRIVDSSTEGHINADDFRFSIDPPQVAPLAEGGGDISAPVWGFADLHTHPMAALAFGRKLFWGEPEGPAESALSPCTPAHGINGTGLPLTRGAGNILMSFFEGTGYRAGIQGFLPPGHRVGGYPQFDGWPKFTTLIHQQMYIEWLQRAYEGGLRLLVAHVVNNQLLAHEFSGHNSQAPFDDRTAVEHQIGAMKELATRHADWMEIAYTPADARRIIRQNKLALVLGIEVDSLGNWKHADDCTDDELRAYLHHLYHDLGVRHLFPVHIANNAFAGAAIYNDMFGVANRFLRGDYLQVEDGSENGVQFRLGEDPGPAVAWYQSPIGIAPAHLGAYYAPPDYRKIPGGHVNVEGLTPRGRALIEEMMRLGMLIDVDHMSHKATNETLAMAEQHDYPVVSGHTELQELAWRRDETASIHKCPSEFKKTPQQLERIRKLGGIVAPIINQGDNRDVGEVFPQLAGKVAANCAGSSTAWAQAYLYAVEKMGGKGVAIGTDTNGFNRLPCPRFGLNAGYYLQYYIPGMGEDAQRQVLRKEQVAAQTNGVRYDEPLKDIHHYRFEGVLEGEVYDSVERDIWQAIAIHDAGLDPWTSSIPAGNDSVENCAKGFCASCDEQLLRPNPFGIGTGNAPWEQRAAFLVKTGQVPQHSERDPAPVHALYEKILPIWQKWYAMQGANVPLKRSYVGERDFDINIDGVAHYGMLPDFLQDLKNVGLTEEDLLPFFRSAEEYIRTWEKCERRKG
jgi:microsomal dipeptidase-like Zn-dependent dipeptidase